MTRQEKYTGKFKGNYIYYIIEKETQNIVYIGETSNILPRYYNHMAEGTRVSTSYFHGWCKANNRSKSEFEFLVLDLTKYEEIDKTDLRLIEKVLQLRYKQNLIVGSNRSKLNKYEIERFEDLSGVIDFKFKAYEELKNEKLIKYKKAAA